ncbi:ankyrin repeat domain-containing protein [Aquimarina gracilis]|uniref:Ankyrin repeat domain-containing protein n=1 Tax=Aquimarina gracilis TaxID=874422 RepID=A0ABU5ZNQ8_9FLAO|nr:ankyrin repeat domain-containing protein [Aquimarina gracilis]MEB3343827.1 ankyrin repeat domain-containing protein [Aquimarina gracilis]
MKKLVILMFCMVFGTVLGNNPEKGTVSHKVERVRIPNVSPFCLSIAKGDYEMVKKMIELGTEVNKVSGGMTPLMYAARYNRVEIIKLLIANGAKVKTRDNQGFTALKYAELSGANEAMKLLADLKKK